MEYKESLKLYEELLESSKTYEQSIIHAHILHNINTKLIEKLDLLQTEISNSSHVMNEALMNLYSHINRCHIDNIMIMDKINKKLFWVYVTWYAMGIYGILHFILILCGVMKS